MSGDNEYGPFLTRRGRGNVLTHFLTAVLGAGLAVVLLVFFFSPASSGSSQPGGDAVPSPAAPALPLTKSEQDIASRVRPGVVIINATLQYGDETAAGTGMVLNPDGLVLTNNHVIEDSTSITVTVLATGKTYTARVLGYDKTGDIALIQLRNASGLTPVPVGDSSSVKARQTVIALGNAGGQNQISTSAGQVTGLRQTITAGDEAGSTSTETLHGMIQTNADIVPGDSGGPLADPAGVIGMDTAAQQEQDYGSSTASPSCSTSNAGLTPPSAIAPVNSGALVVGTLCGSPADRAGLTAGAVITAVNGRPVGSPGQLSAILARFRPGDTISVTWVSPAGQQTTSGVRLAAGPPQ